MGLKERLLQLRKERKMSQDEVGKTIGVMKSQVSNWEQGKGKPSLDSLLGLSKLFSVSTDYLLFDNIPREGVEAINDLELYDYFRKAEALPKEHKETVKDVIDGLVFREKVKGIPETTSAKNPKETPLRKVAGKR